MSNKIRKIFPMRIVDMCQECPDLTDWDTCIPQQKEIKDTTVIDPGCKLKNVKSKPNHKVQCNGVDQCKVGKDCPHGREHEYTALCNIGANMYELCNICYCKIKEGRNE